MNSIRVIGVGSPYGDDQLGWTIVEQLKAKFIDTKQHVSLLRCETPATELLTYLDQAQCAIVIDAIHTDLPVGQVCSWHQLSVLPTTSVSSHGLDLTTLLQLAASLNQLPAQWMVCGIVIDPENKQLNHSLSPPVQQAIPTLIKHIQQTLSCL